MTMKIENGERLEMVSMTGVMSGYTAQRIREFIPETTWGDAWLNELLVILSYDHRYDECRGQRKVTDEYRDDRRVEHDYGMLIKQRLDRSDIGLRATAKVNGIR